MHCIGGKKWLWLQPNLLFNVAFTLQPDRFPAPPRLPVLAREVGGGGRAQSCLFPLQCSSVLCFPATAVDEEPFCLVFQAVWKNQSICKHWWTLTEASLLLKTGQCVAWQLGLLLPSVLFFSACFSSWWSKAALRSWKQSTKWLRKQLLWKQTVLKLLQRD